MTEKSFQGIGSSASFYCMEPLLVLFPMKLLRSIEYRPCLCSYSHRIVFMGITKLDS
jgi:hypothetical protein